MSEEEYERAQRIQKQAEKARIQLNITPKKDSSQTRKLAQAEARNKERERRAHDFTDMITFVFLIIYFLKCPSRPQLQGRAVPPRIMTDTTQWEASQKKKAPGKKAQGQQQQQQPQKQVKKEETFFGGTPKISLVFVFPRKAILRLLSSFLLHFFPSLPPCVLLFEHET